MATTREIVIPKDLAILLGVSKPTSYRRLAHYKKIGGIINDLPEMPLREFCRITGFREDDVRAKMIG